MKTLYLDVFSGIAGDMFIGALLDLGVDAKRLERELKKLGLDGYHLHVSRQQRSAIAGVKFDVHISHPHGHEHSHESEQTRHVHDHSHEHSHEHHHEHAHAHSHAHHHEDPHEHSHEHSHQHSHNHDRNFSDIKQLITKSTLSAWVKQKAIAVFGRIAEAEGKIHGHPADKVHFHEVGAVDSIVDIVGAAVALELLGKPRVLSAPVIEGTGWIHCAHGRFPVPAPATLEILGARGIAVTQCEEPNELITPTGAAILAEFAESFGAMENLVAEKIGFGLGTRENQTRPNVLRAILGKQSKAKGAKSAIAETDDRWETDRIAVLETNLDDCSGEILGAFIETALAAGALDVFHTPIQMKKNRPGILLTILCAESEADSFSELILQETTSFGVRKTIADRRKLVREFVTAQTPFGEVTVKIGRLGKKVVQASPEFESARKLAKDKKVPAKQVVEAAMQSARKLKR